MDFVVDDYVRLISLVDNRELREFLGREGYVVKRRSNANCTFGIDYNGPATKPLPGSARAQSYISYLI